MFTANYRQEFLRHPYHGYLAIATIGLGLMSATLIGFVGGLIGYAFGWLWIPDMKFFRSKIDNHYTTLQQNEDAGKLATFNTQRQRLIDSLSADHKNSYRELIQVCHDIEQSSTDTGQVDQNDPRLRNLDKLMWTYLKLLIYQERMENFLEAESDEDLSKLSRDAKTEVDALALTLNGATEEQKATPAYQSKTRYFTSRKERMDVLVKRLERVDLVKDNLKILSSEQERLYEQIKLIRSEVVATKNSDALSLRIDSTVEHLDETNKLFSDIANLDIYNDQDIPTAGQRVGYGYGDYSGRSQADLTAPYLPSPTPNIIKKPARRVANG